jgi:hypothetical protein
MSGHGYEGLQMDRSALPGAPRPASGSGLRRHLAGAEESLLEAIGVISSPETVAGSKT